jgi:predicted RNA-binding protein YlqC (UPF0109 family)
VKELVEYIAKSIVDNPDQVTVREMPQGDRLVIHLSVAPADMGKIIGKQGRVAEAIRALLKVAATRQGSRVRMEISEGTEPGSVLDIQA